MIPLAEPNLTGKEKEYVADAIASNWVSGGGPYVERFEEMVAKAAGKKWAVATITGTAALHAAIKILGMRGEIKVPLHTFVAAKNVIRMMGFTPIFEKGEINYDAAKIHQYDDDNYSGWPLLIDAAPAIGTKLSPATLHMFSFNGNKTITTGQGGAIVGDDPMLENLIRKLIVPKEGGEFNYRMANLNAAMGCAQMERLDEFLEKKKTIWNRYKAAGFTMIDCGKSRWMPVIRVPSGHIAIDANIDIRPLWKTNTLCLPCSTTLTTDQQDKVIKVCAFL